jgi:puromycin-sensitive aminopeptidase
MYLPKAFFSLCGCLGLASLISPKQLFYTINNYVSLCTCTTTIYNYEKIHVHLKATTVTFLFPTTLPVPSSDITTTSILLTIHYAGCLNNQMAGFYRSTYTDYQGVEKIVASTQFEALDARRALPCVDEPAAKATFVVTLINIPSTLECFSNMPEASRVTSTTTTTSSSSSSSSLVTVTFLETPKMSTYLLAFCIGEFDYVQGQTKHGVLIKVYAPKGRSASGHYALDCALQCLDAYDDFFGTPYPLPKLDMVAIPEFVSVYPTTTTKLFSRGGCGCQFG